MIAMYVGFRLMGLLGLIGGPILLNLLRVVLEADMASRKTNEITGSDKGNAAAVKKE